MPWTGRTFHKHNRKLSAEQSTKAAKIATAMVKSGADEGVAIATANARAEGKPRRKKWYGKSET